MDTTIEVPFLVVGAGPVGLTAVRLLANRGRRSLLVERRDGPQRAPAAHVVNPRTLEVFRQAGLDMDAIHSVAEDPADSGHVNFLTRLDGELIGRLRFERQGTDCLDLTPTPLRNISQHRLEPILAESVRCSDGAELRYRTQWESSEQGADCVTSRIRDLDTGDRTTVRSRYVIAADGAGSGLRSSLGIDMVGPRRLQSFMAIHFGADLRPVVAERPGVLHFVLDPAVAGAFVAHDIDREWVFMVEFDPEEESAEDYDTARCERIVRAAIGNSDVDIDVLGAGSWHMSAQVAERFGDGRIFLVGDAAHRFPPTGGLGLNTGVADVHGLVWKLCAVEDGWAAPPLLDTYEVERRPVAQLNCEQSTADAITVVSLLEALDIAESPSSEAMQAALRDPGRRESIDSAVEQQATHFDLIGLQLGHCYAEGALVRQGEAPAQMEDPSRLDPDATVGERLPHAWSGDGLSTLDLVDPAALTLLTFGAHDTWAGALVGLGAPVRHVRMGTDAVVADNWRRQCGLATDGALLVRPDQHVAWRGEAAGAAGELGRAVEQTCCPERQRPQRTTPENHWEQE